MGEFMWHRHVYLLVKMGFWVCTSFFDYYLMRQQFQNLNLYSPYPQAIRDVLLVNYFLQIITFLVYINIFSIYKYYIILAEIMVLHNSFNASKWLRV